MKVISFGDLAASDLVVDAIYESSRDGQMAGEPIARLLPGSGNQGGFRAAGRGEEKNWVVLTTSGEDPDWPDVLNLNTGEFVYFGDNKSPGRELHDTARGGNAILRKVFAQLHDQGNPRQGIPPFFLFQKNPTVHGARSVRFLGVAAPGFPGMSALEDLIAVWKATSGERFQNYRAVLTVLDIPVVQRAWLIDLAVGVRDSIHAPNAWRSWLRDGRYRPLTAEPTTNIRSAEQQVPSGALQIEILRAVWEYFRDTPVAFEAFAARIYQLVDHRVVIDEITRGSVDGGRDAIGRHLLGLNDDPVYAEFSLEAKCYQPPIDGHSANTVGVKEVSRLISRIRHRQYGVLVTTSLVARQAYEEVREDRHPIIFIAGKDIAEILVRNGYSTAEHVRRLLLDEFPS
ncbi:restriction endonuclease [Geothrix mesophila]|uniref:restriction endonuclease n=1 Tax=Geothrix mesophila TaxID=2922723 RepID=UPI001FAB8720